MPRALLFLFLFIGCSPVYAQTIKGDVMDMETKHPIKGVSIQNIHTSFGVTTDDSGSFIIVATSGQLLEFVKPGYKTVRVRIPQGFIPPYFRIIMQKGLPSPGDNIAQNRYNYKKDSLTSYEIYKHELDYPRLSAFDAMQHPFSALSKRNREIWRFQEEYDYFEKEKYIDRTFSAAIITRITGLQGDSLRNYIRRYRPGYEQLRNMNDYSFFSYIKNTVHNFRSRDLPRSSQ